MQQFSSLQEAQFKAAWLTIGAFDGVHIGHQEILKSFTAGAHSENAPAVVLTFYPHPVEVLRGPLESFYLSSPERKTKEIAALGVDALITHPFSKEFSKTPAKEFVAELKEQLDLRQLWVGEDFALGHNREGDVPTLLRFGEEMGFKLKAFEAVEIEGEVVSSSRIRQQLAEGEVVAAQRLLGRPYALSGEVVKGVGRGVSIGIPTANLSIWPKRAVPRSGVYVCRAQLGKGRWGAVTNIGVRPTFEDELLAPVVESHLLDYDGGEFYGQELRIEFLARLRDERRFPGADELLEQIQKDIEKARKLLTKHAADEEG